MLLPSSFLYIAPITLLIFSNFFVKLFTLKINKNILIGFFLLLLTGSVVQFINVILQSTAEAVTYWILSPIYWFLLVFLLRQTNNFVEIIDSSIRFVGAVVVIVNISYVILFTSGVIQNNISCFGFIAYFGLSDVGFFAYSTSLLPHISFLAPYFAMRYYYKRDTLDLFILLLLVLSTILSLRVTTSFFAGLSLVYLWYKLVQEKTVKMIIIALCIFLILLYLFFQIPQDIIDAIYNLKLADEIQGEDQRFMQIKVYFESFLLSPFYGHGISSVSMQIYDMATGEMTFNRLGTVDNPYGYEVFGAKLLNDIGLLIVIPIGVYIYYLYIKEPINKYIWISHALRLGALFFILTSQTNTYLGTSGWMWVLMLPFVFIYQNNRLDKQGENINENI